MNIVHRVTGYDKRTEMLSYQFDVPQERLSEVRDLARVAPDDDVALGSYPLDNSVARTIAGKLNLPMIIERCDWFLEPFAAE